MVVMPPGLCLGAPPPELIAVAPGSNEARQFWRGYAIGGAIAGFLLLIEALLLVR